MTSPEIIGCKAESGKAQAETMVKGAGHETEGRKESTEGDGTQTRPADGKSHRLKAE